ncbi:4859_t:CDS:2, partial [Racocetra persica]
NSNKPTRVSFEPVSLNNSIPIPAHNVARSIHQSQDFYNHNDYSSSYASRSRSSYNLDPELIHNSDYIPSNIPIQSNFTNQNLTYDTYSSNKNANRLQVPFNGTNNSEDRFDSSLQQNSYNHYKENDLMTNLRPQRTSHPPVNPHNTTTQDEQSLVNWLYTQPDLITQVQNLSTASPYK